MDQALFPAMAKVQEHREPLASAYRGAAAVVACVVLPISAGLWVLAPEIVAVILGPGWEGAIAPFGVLSLVVLFRATYKISDSLARATGAVYRRAWRQAVYAVAVVVFGALGQRYGLAGLATRVAVAITLNFLLMAYLSTRLAALSWRDIASAHLGALPAFLVTWGAAALCADLTRALGWPALAVIATCMLATGLGAGGARRPGAALAPRSRRRRRARDAVPARPGPFPQGPAHRAAAESPRRRQPERPRMSTAGVPNFFIGGAQKSGTTTLHWRLKEHPQVFIPDFPQEIHFFDDAKNFERGLRWYEGLFAGWKGQRAVGQTSPLYLYAPEVPERIHAVLPDARFVFILRDPVDRAYAHYWHSVKKGYDSLELRSGARGGAGADRARRPRRRYDSYLGRSHGALVARMSEIYSAMRAAFDADDTVAYRTLDGAYHQAMIDLCGNPFIRDAYSQVGFRIQACARVSPTRPG